MLKLMKHKTIKIKVSPAKVGAYLGLAVLVFASLSGIPKAFATTMTQTQVLEYNMNASGAGAVAVAFKAGAADAAGTLTVNFGSGGTVASTQTVTTTGCTSIFTGATVLPTSGTLTAAGAGSTITVSSVNTLTSGTLYCVILTSTTAVTNNATPGNYTAVVTDGTDTNTVGTDVISSDVINVTASVGQIFTLGFGANTDALGALSTGSLTTSGGVALTVTTNAASGWGLWAEDSNAGLKSTITGHTIATVATGSNQTMNAGKIGTDAYALGVTSANATTNYADAGGITGGGLSTSAYNEIATAASPGTGVAVNVKELADVAGTTAPASDFADAVTIVGAGSF
jgi:hypothetical protein